MNHQKFLKVYRTDKNASWIKVKLSDNTEHYFSHHRSWLEVKRRCDEKDLNVLELHLSFKSHNIEIELEDIDAIYLVKSVLGMMGGITNHYITIGRLIDGKMHKDMYRVPELTKEKGEVVGLDECFKQAIIYYDKTKENREEQV
tara:strand:- start:561 stop:992 length:432 start_codon:yes stop_codon:yes gene_type:complete